MKTIISCLFILYTGFASGQNNTWYFTGIADSVISISSLNNKIWAATQNAGLKVFDQTVKLQVALALCNPAKASNPQVQFIRIDQIELARTMAQHPTGLPSCHLLKRTIDGQKAEVGHHAHIIQDDLCQDKTGL